MPKRPNRLPTAPPVRLSVSPKVLSYLEQLVDSGLYGKNTTEAIQHILLDALRRLKRDGEIKAN
jgi:hypothetical protein